MKKLKIYCAILLILMLIAFSTPWYPTYVPLKGEYGFQKMNPSPLHQYFIGSEPYTGWDILPFTAPCVIGFLLGLAVLLTKRRPFALSMVAGALIFLGVLVAGLACAPSVIETWTSPQYIYGRGGPALENGWYFALLTSVAYLVGGAVLARSNTSKK